MVRRLFLVLKGLLFDVLNLVRHPQDGFAYLRGVSLYRNSVFLILNSLATSGTGFLFWIVAARLYPTEAVGIASAAISAIMLLSIVSNLGLHLALIRFLPHAGDKAQSMINTCYTVSVLVSAVLAIIFVAGLNLWLPDLIVIRDNATFTAIFVIAVIAMTLTELELRTFVAKRKSSFSLVTGLSFGLLRFIPIIVMAAYFESFGIVASWAIAAAVGVFIGIVFLIPRMVPGYRFIPGINKTLLLNMMSFASANFFTNLLMNVPAFIFPLMVINLLGPDDNAHYYIARAIADVIIIIMISVGPTLFAEGSHDQTTVRKNVLRAGKFMLAILIPSVTFIFVAGDKLLLLFGSEYADEGTWLLRLLVASAVPQAVVILYNSVKRIEMRMKPVLYMAISSAAALLVMSWLLLPVIGIVAVGVARLSVEAVLALIVLGLWFLEHRRGQKTSQV